MLAMSDTGNDACRATNAANERPQTSNAVNEPCTHEITLTLTLARILMVHGWAWTTVSHCAVQVCTIPVRFGFGCHIPHRSVRWGQGGDVGTARYVARWGRGYCATLCGTAQYTSVQSQLDLALAAIFRVVYTVGGQLVTPVSYCDELYCAVCVPTIPVLFGFYMPRTVRSCTGRYSVAARQQHRYCTAPWYTDQYWSVPLSGGPTGTGCQLPVQFVCVLVITAKYPLVPVVYRNPVRYRSLLQTRYWPLRYQKLKLCQY
jgi:hypothetical protein